MSSKKIKFNVRVNSSILYLFCQIGANKYNIKTVSKFFIDRLDYYLDRLGSSNVSSDEFIVPTFNYYTLNKNYTIQLDYMYISKLKELSKALSISESECFRRVLMLVCFNNAFLMPQPFVYSYNRAQDETYTKFRFSVSRELLSMYRELCSSLDFENNLTAALNDAIKESLYKIKKQDSSFLENILNEDTLNIKNDYKYNFKISNRRFKEFTLACESIGVSPQECLRKSISFYVKDKTKDINKVEIEN